MSNRNPELFLRDYSWWAWKKAGMSYAAIAADRGANYSHVYQRVKKIERILNWHTIRALFGPEG